MMKSDEVKKGKFCVSNFGTGGLLGTSRTRRRHATIRGGGAEATTAWARAYGDRDRAAHGRARRHDRERGAAAHPGRAALLRGEPGMGRQRLRARLRRAAAARRAIR